MVLLAEYNIQMNQLNSSGTYDTLYPSSIASQITQINSASDYGLDASSSVDNILSLLKNSLQVNLVSNTYGDLSVGDIVSLNVNGVAYDWIVVQQGVPSSMYDSSCNGTWLMMKDCYTNSQWYTGQNLNDYGTSYINTYLNTTFFNLLNSEVQSQISQVKIPYVDGPGKTGVIKSGSNGLNCKVFLLGIAELGWGDYLSNPIDGSVLSYFEEFSNTDPRRIAYLNNVATAWWTRSPSVNSETIPYNVSANGGVIGGHLATTSYGVRPVIIMPSTTLYSTSYTFTYPNGTSISDAITQIETGSYVGTGTTNTSISFNGALKFCIIQGKTGTDAQRMILWSQNSNRMWGNVATSSGSALGADSSGAFATYENDTLSFSVNGVNTPYYFNQSGNTYEYIGIVG